LDSISFAKREILPQVGGDTEGVEYDYSQSLQPHPNPPQAWGGNILKSYVLRNITIILMIRSTIIAALELLREG